MLTPVYTSPALPLHPDLPSGPPGNNYWLSQVLLASHGLGFPNSKKLTPGLHQSFITTPLSAHQLLKPRLLTGPVRPLHQIVPEVTLE